MVIPNYSENSLVNLMSSIIHHFHGNSPYASLKRPVQLKQNVVLIVLDGLGYEYLKKKGQNSIFAKHLDQQLTSIFPSTTAAAMTSFYTGLAPHNHAVISWFTYLREVGVISTILPFCIRGFNYSLKTKTIEPEDILQFPSLLDKLPVLKTAIIPTDFMTAPYSQVTLKHIQKLGSSDLDQILGSILWQLTQPSAGPQLIFAYWPGFDHYAHETGIGSEKTFTHFTYLDTKIRHFFDELDRRVTDTTILITADHGLLDSTPETYIDLQQHPKFAECLTLPLSGEARAPIFYVRPSKVTQFESYFHQFFSTFGQLYKSEDLIAMNYFGLHKPHPRLFERTGDYIALMDKNCLMRDHILGENPESLIDFHGGISPDEFFVPLIVK